jgi:hypothetical protein
MALFKMSSLILSDIGSSLMSVVRNGDGDKAEDVSKCKDG